jgi:uncharacterized membrane protein
VTGTAYALPWYDALPWALLALVTQSWRDWLLLAHTAVLSLAYLPGRDVRIDPMVGDVTRVMRTDVAPMLLTLVLAAAFALTRSGSCSAGSGARRSPL